MSAILTATRGHAFFITLNRPAALNALTLEMVRDIHAALRTAQATDAIEQIVLLSASEKAFCAGGDVRAVAQYKNQPEQAAHFFRAEYELNATIASSSKPVIALVDGVCMGGGLGLAVHAKYCVATERSVWAMPETLIGLFPDIGAGYFLQNCPAGFAPWFTLSGARITGEQACAVGLAPILLESSEVELISQQLEHHAAEQLFASFTRKRQFLCTTAEISEWIASLPQRAQTEAAGSPTSIRLTQAHLAACRGLGLRAVLQRDYRLACGCLRGHDFYEGVRAALIDKDKKPNWQPKHLAEVTQLQLEQHLAAPFGPELFES